MVLAKVDQRTNAPTRKVTAAGIGGAVLPMVLALAVYIAEGHIPQAPGWLVLLCLAITGGGGALGAGYVTRSTAEVPTADGGPPVSGSTAE